MKKKNQKLNLSRRNLLKIGAGALGTGVLTAGISSNLASPARAVSRENMTPEQALEMLMEGNKRFVSRKIQAPNRTMVRIREVAQTQKPFASILSCADSRVPSEIVFDQGFGDLFICRVAGNVATPEEIGSLEFGTLVLGSKVLIVMGHERCGAVSAAVKNAEVPGQIGSLIDAIKPAITTAGSRSEKSLTDLVKGNVMYQVEKLKASPVISKLVEEGKLKVVGAYYDLDTGAVSLI